jgi:hypothetical protein
MYQVYHPAAYVGEDGAWCPCCMDLGGAGGTVGHIFATIKGRFWYVQLKKRF